jgi:hypothetical protein
VVEEKLVKYLVNRKLKVENNIITQILRKLIMFQRKCSILIFSEHLPVLRCISRRGKSCDRSVSIVLGYGLDNQGSRVRFLAGAGNFSLHHHVQNGFGGHPASYPMGTRGSFPGGKVART